MVARRVVDGGRDSGTAILDSDGPVRRVVVVVRLSSGSTFATGRMSLSNTVVVIKPSGLWLGSDYPRSCS